MNQMIGMLLASVLAAGSISAADAPPKIDPAGLRQVVIEPQSFNLLGSRARQQLIVTGISSGDETLDLTGQVEFVSSNPGVVRIEGSQAVPVANGECQVTVTLGGTPVPRPVSLATLKNRPP